MLVSPTDFQLVSAGASMRGVSGPGARVSPGQVQALTIWAMEERSGTGKQGSWKGSNAYVLQSIFKLYHVRVLYN